MQQLSKYKIPSQPTCLEVDIKGGVAFIGCTDGTIQILDLSDRTTLKMVNILKLYSNPITSIRRSPDASMLAVCSDKEKGIYFVSTSPVSNFPVMAYLPLVGRVYSIDWFQPDPTAPLKLIAILHNSLLVSLTPPTDSMNVIG